MDTDSLQDHGFRPSEIKTDEHYMLGGFSLIGERFQNEVLMPAGHGWKASIPPRERQNRDGLETMNCTNYATLQALETIAAFKKYRDFPENGSERYSGVCTGTTDRGNNPHDVVEILRSTAGVLREERLPFDERIKTWGQYYSPKPMTQRLTEEAREILDLFKIGHQWVFDASDSIEVKRKKLIEALAHGTVCVSVTAWRKNANGLYYKKPDDRDNHWTHLVDYAEGSHFEVSDSYEPFEKLLAWDYDFEQAKVYYLDKLPPKKAVFLRMIQLMKSMLSALRKSG